MWIKQRTESSGEMAGRGSPGLNSFIQPTATGCGPEPPYSLPKYVTIFLCLVWNLNAGVGSYYQREQEEMIRLYSSVCEW